MSDPLDMSQFIEARSDQLNADDLLDAPRTITITRVSGTGSAEQPVAVHYEGENGRPFMPCKTVRRIMVGAWGKYTDQYVGRSMTLYRDPAVSFGGMVVGGIRVSHMSHIDGEKTLALQVTRGRKAPFKVLPLKMKPQPADEQAVALKAITEAAENGTEALANVWKQKWMAPHRDALQLDLERLKAVAAKNDPPSAEGSAPASEQPDNANSAAGNITENITAEATQSFNMADQLTIDEQPGKAKADEIIAEINAANAIIDVNSIYSRNKADIEAMPPELGASVDIAADQRKREIEAERETAGAK